MELIVNYPTNQKKIDELNKEMAKIHATLLIDEIDKLDIDDSLKKKVLNGILSYLKKEIDSEGLYNDNYKINEMP